MGRMERKEKGMARDACVSANPKEGKGGQGKTSGGEGGEACARVCVLCACALSFTWTYLTPSRSSFAFSTICDNKRVSSSLSSTLCAFEATPKLVTTRRMKTRHATRWSWPPRGSSRMLLLYRLWC